MGERLIKPYEISVWEEQLTQNGFIEEKKLAVIGSDTMTGLNKVYDPVFNKKSNGEKTLSFSLKYKYFDPYSGTSDYVNPFAALLINERKVKLYYNNEWYEFIIKDHTESSDGLEWTYTCSDAFVLELSKIGYNITFDSELNNNQGTAEELAKITLKDTNWQLGGANVGKQLVAEPIYSGIIVNNFIAKNTDTNVNESFESSNDVNNPNKIYVFYSYVKNKNGKFVQFIKQAETYTIDDNNVITATNYRILDDVVVTSTGITLNNNEIISFENIETKYQANRLVYNQLTTYDPVMDRTVDIFKSGDRTVYKYTDYAYTTSNVVTNFITNGDNFNVLEDGTLQGWNPYVDFTGRENPVNKIDKLELVTYPELNAGKPLANIEKLSQIEGFLKATFKGPLTNDYKNTVYNSGFSDSASMINSIAKGDKFVFRWRAGTGEPNQLVAANNLRLLVAKYTQEAPTFGYYYKFIDSDNIILDFQLKQNENIENYKSYNEITGGNIITQIVDGETIYNYVIDDVPQILSTKYVYINSNDNIKYVWDKNNSVFVRLDNATWYLPYYYLVAEAQQSISNAVIKDPTEKIGIFIYYVGNQSTPKTYYIQDIQLTRFIPDADDKPIIMGNVPTATSITTDYYYFKPEESTAAEDVETYTSPEQLGLNDLTPAYNDDSEKVLSISASKSNCFNILQTIAETFECWVDLVVEHDINGAIKRINGEPQKFVYLREYIGKDNWSGFKYGINIQSIERTINSDEIVTKLIVDQSQSDYVDEGYISIANAPSNQSGESYILNFDYYYNQGLLNRDEVEPNKLAFIEAIAQKNIELKEKEKKRSDLELSLTTLNSKRTVYSELVTTAEDTQGQALEEFEQLTGQSYSTYQELQKDAIVYEEESYIVTPDTTVNDDKIYYIRTNNTFNEVENPTGNPHNHGWYEVLDELLAEETVFDVLGKLYTSSATINNYSGILINIEQEYWKIRRELHGSENYYIKIWVDRDANDERHVCIELNDYLPDFEFTLGNLPKETATINKKYWDITSDASSISFNAPTGYTIVEEVYEINDNKIKKIKINSSETYPGVEDDIDDIQDEKDELIKDFNNKYSRFIQEGTWSSTDYIDSELYYLDALQVSNTSAQPAVSYTINVVEISELEGFEDYLFDAGDKTYIEDTEFFGWANVNGTLTPAREEVIVSEVEWHLDDPSQNIITVQNYKTRFEDLFQRISAAVQTVEYNEATYAKISSLLDANGTINQNVLLDSLNRLGGQNYNLTSDGSVMINGDQILVQNLTNLANRVILNSEGLRISSDGGQTWKTAISGEGINIGTVYTGTLNTQNVIIGSSENPSFRWDKSGISAYKLGDNDIYDLKTFVRYDQYGLYGIKNSAAFKPQGETFEARLRNVKETAHFAVTWDGFFIRNSYEGGGQVSITSDNDFQVLNDPTKQGDFREKIKIGALEWKDSNDNITTNPEEGVGLPILYGIRINDNDGNWVLKTGDNGNLEIKGTIYATGGEFNDRVTVGQINQNHIIIDGTNGPNSPSISSSNYNDGASTGWIVNKDGDAVFNNITARGAIKTAVFEYAEIQAVGGIFIFRPSSIIKSARISDSGTDLIVEVENPLLFKKIFYNKVLNPASNSNPQLLGWYERPAYGGYKLTNDVIVNVEKEYYVRIETSNGSWCKISNYISDGIATDSTIHNILETNGLTHVYEISAINVATGEITLAGAKSFVDAVKQTEQTNQDVLNSLVGGSLIDMGDNANGNGQVGNSNYGIGINSSDNTVNLPARAISLFETKINPSNTLKVTYDIRGILGTLPILEYTGADAKVHALYHENLEGTQGIYTDNMYVGNHEQYIAFYKDSNNAKHLKVNAKELTLKAGTFNVTKADHEQNFVYLSNENYGGEDSNGISIGNSELKSDWRHIIGSKFGVDRAGNLYATNAYIQGTVVATSGYFGSEEYGAVIRNGKLEVPESNVTGLSEKLITISNQASQKGYTLYVQATYPDYPDNLNIETDSDEITLTAYVYYGNNDITQQCDPNLFVWKLKKEDEVITLSLDEDSPYYVEDNPYSIKYDRNDAGYGATIVCNFAIDEEALLVTPDNYALETPDGYLLTARV